jgi:hypothetical protein
MHKSVSAGRFPTLPRAHATPFVAPRSGRFFATAALRRIRKMLVLAAPYVLAAAGWSLLYLLFGGGLGGAVLIFIVLKLLGR